MGLLDIFWIVPLISLNSMSLVVIEYPINFINILKIIFVLFYRLFNVIDLDSLSGDKLVFLHGCLCIFFKVHIPLHQYRPIQWLPWLKLKQLIWELQLEQLFRWIYQQKLVFRLWHHGIYQPKWLWQIIFRLFWAKIY